MGGQKVYAVRKGHRIGVLESWSECQAATNGYPGSRGNPGRAGYGYAVFDSDTGRLLRLGCRPLPFGSTNNQAEYSGMIAGMEVSGERLLPLYREAKQLQTYCRTFNIEHIYR
eukprot:gene7993-8191_t